MTKKKAKKRHGVVTEVTPGLEGGVTIVEGETTYFFGNDSPNAVPAELRHAGTKCSLESRDGRTYATKKARAV